VVDSIVPVVPDTTAEASLRDRAARAATLALLRRLRHGSVTVVEEAGRRHDVGVASSDDPRATVTVLSPAAWRAVLTGGSVGLGLSYAYGWWDTDDLVALVRIAARNTDGLPRVRAPRVGGVGADKELDRRNIRAHYDLGNEFFSLFLDETMTYSCAVFESPATTLADASRAKLDRICRKLALGPDDHVVEIGTGWGSFAVHAACRFGCRVTTTTISDRQYEFASKRVADAGLADRVTVRHDDYRDLTGAYDALVSIEMIEAVDWRQYDTFFAACAGLLRPEGRMGLQAIVVADQRFEQSKRRTDFIKGVIFPGSCVPSIEAITRSVTRATDLRIVDLEDIGRHYAETLNRWRENLGKAHDAVLDLGLGEAFLRMWDFYLAYCEAGFLERRVSDVQLVLARSGWRAPALAPRAL